MTDELKEVARTAWMEGFKYGRHVESHSDFELRCASIRFDRWWDVNAE